MLQLNRNDYEDLNNTSKDLDKEISDFYSNLNKYYNSYNNNEMEIFLSEFFNIK